MEHHIHSLMTTGYMSLIFDTFVELHGDRKSGDDMAVTGGLARLGEYKAVAVGCRFAIDDKAPEIPNAKGYRKLLRLAHLAEAFAKPLVFFVSFPELSPPPMPDQQTEEAIARSLGELACLMTPVICVIASKSSNAMAMQLCAADRILMLEGASYRVVPSDDARSDNADSQSPRLKAQELMDIGVVSRILKMEPGDISEDSIHALKTAILDELDQLIQIHPEALVHHRMNRLQYLFRSFNIHGFSSADRTAVS